MYIKRIIIESFGKIEDKEINFTDHINILYGDNESGKSTILAFLKACLYGLSSRGKISDRKKYMPWGKESCGGQIYFSYKNKGYRYICQFGQSKRQDKFTLYDELSGDEVPLPTGLSLGEHLFSLSEGAFDSSIFIPQLETFVDISKDKEGQIVSKLANDQIEDASINIVEKRLKKALDSISSQRTKNGLVDKLLERQKENKEQFDLFFKEEKRIKKINQQIEDLEERYDIGISTIRAHEAWQILKERDQILEKTKRISDLKKRIESINTNKINIFYPLSLFLFLASIGTFFLLEEYKLLALIPLTIALLSLFLAYRARKRTYDLSLILKEKEKEEEILKHIIGGRNINNIKKEWEEAKLIGPSKVDKIEEVINENKEIEREIYSLKAQLDLRKGEFNYSQLLAEQEEIISKIDSYDEISLALSYAHGIMQSSYKVLQETFAPSLSKEIGEIFKEFRLGQETIIKVNKDFELSLDEKEGYMPYHYYSGGTIDQAYLAFRLALAKTLVKDFVLPLYLDEPFAQYDEKRLKTSFSYLFAFNQAHNNQIIFTSCQDRILGQAGSIGKVNIIKI